MTVLRTVRAAEDRAPSRRENRVLLPFLTLSGAVELSPKGSPSARKYSRTTSLQRTSDRAAPYFLRARRDKQLLTVFPSLTFCPKIGFRIFHLCRMAQHRSTIGRHHFERSENIIAAFGTNERCYAVGINEVAFSK